MLCGAVRERKKSWEHIRSEHLSSSDLIREIEFVKIIQESFSKVNELSHIPTVVREIDRAVERLHPVKTIS